MSYCINEEPSTHQELLNEVQQRLLMRVIETAITQAAAEETQENNIMISKLVN